MHQKTLGLRIIGFIASLLLTVAAYLIIIRPEFFHLSARLAFFVIFMLAIAQSVVQYIFFLHLRGEKEPTWNIATFVSTILLIIIIIAFSIWIMDTLDYRMMPFLYFSTQSG